MTTITTSPGLVPRIFSQSAIPLVLPSSGSIANNGALTALTALPNTYASCYMYFPVNAIASGVAAGLYYVVMSSTTAGTIYNNTYTSGDPTIPANPTAFSTTGPGAYTQTTASALTLASVTVSANSMGANGSVRNINLWSMINNGNNKVIACRFGTMFMGLNITLTTTGGYGSFCEVHNRGVTNSQVARNSGSGFGALGTPVFAANDTTANQTLILTAQLATATDWIVLESYTNELLTT